MLRLRSGSHIGLNPAGCEGCGSGMGLEAGDKAPNFKLATDDGGTVTPASLKGAPYVLYFYPKDDTSGCTKEAIAFSGLLPKFTKLGVPVIGVSRDGLESHEKFRK